MNKSKQIKLAALLLAFCLTLTGCADAVYVSTQSDVGLLHGFIHGLILPFAFIGSIFSDDIAIYAAYNNGCWYDFGYIFGIAVVWK